jgi:hypothetical protein
MTAIASTSGRLHCEFVCLFLQGHQQTDRFLAASGVQFAQPPRGFKSVSLRINLNQKKKWKLKNT